MVAYEKAMKAVTVMRNDRGARCGVVLRVVLNSAAGAGVELRGAVQWS
jgi:uridine phosphorylase